MIAGILYAIVGFIEVLLGLRFAFRLLGANPASTFVDWVYDWSTPLAAPFAGIFGQEATVAGPGVVTQSVFDWTALIALIVYGLIGAVLARAAASLGPR
ncbi:YggT family protein [Candidatus Parcubacteria bacterium]|nr:YggT family protein [Candidatus Parcubacteria bacterium]